MRHKVTVFLKLINETYKFTAFHLDMKIIWYYAIFQKKNGFILDGSNYHIIEIGMTQEFLLPIDHLKWKFKIHNISPRYKNHMV